MGRWIFYLAGGLLLGVAPVLKTVIGVLIIIALLNDFGILDSPWVSNNPRPGQDVGDANAPSPLAEVYASHNDVISDSDTQWEIEDVVSDDSPHHVWAEDEKPIS